MDTPEPLTEPLTDPQEDPGPALLAARRCIESFETISGAGPLPEPMRTQLIECMRMGYEAALERVVRLALEEFIREFLLPAEPGKELSDPNALNPTPLVSDGTALAINLGLDSEGGITLE